MPAETAHFVPSAEHAIEDQRAPGIELEVHVLPRSDEPYNAPLPEMATIREAFAEQAIPDHAGLCDGNALAAFQLSALLVETWRAPELCRLTRICPSEEQATQLPLSAILHGSPPELVDTKVKPPATMITEPSADEAIEVQVVDGEVVAFQFAPPFVEAYTGLE